jgi:tripartite-type tricarboxylate transporter receptor subunit TctC
MTDFVRLAFAVVALLMTSPARADAVADFYSGKTVHVIIGYSVGGGSDNKPGAGSLMAANFIYGAAPKDGTAFGTFGRGIVMEPLFERSQGARFDPTKFTWIGSITDEVSVCAFSAASGIKSWDDLKSAKKPMAVGATGSGSDTDVYAIVARNVLRAPLKLVTGYPGGAEIVLALQRGEVDGRCGWSWSSLRSRERQLYESKQINLVLQISAKKHEELQDVPLMMDLAPSEKDKAAIKLVVAREMMARPFAAPPGIPADRAAALRKAFDMTMKDPAFLAEAQRMSLEVRPLDGTGVDALVKEIYATPKDVVELATAAVKIAPEGSNR